MMHERTLPDPFGYLLEQPAAPNGYVFITPGQYATIKDEFQHLYRPIYTEHELSALLSSSN